jgi:energy-coupling factor transporter ATP-binding protein EcfA2
MTDEVLVASLGTYARIRCREDTLANRIAQLYDACRIEHAFNADVAVDIDIRRHSAGYEVLADGEPHWQGSDADRALEWCAWLVNNVATERAPALVLHAAAAALDERAILLTGPSGSGKSTLVTALALRNAAYMGDDTITVDEDHHISANPKPIGIDTRARAALLQLRDNAELRAESALAAPNAVGRVLRSGQCARPNLVVRATYHPHAPASLTPISPADVAEMLADQSFNFARLGEAALRPVTAIAREACGFELEFGDLADAVDAVFEAARADHVSVADDPPGWSSRDLHVEFCRGEALIWKQDTKELHHLSATATDIWSASFISDDSELVAAAIVGSRPTPIVVADVRRCLGELRASGLLPVRPGGRPPVAVGTVRSV